MVKKYTMVDTEQKERLSKLGITRNITTLYDLKCWLVPFFTLNKNKYFLNLQTLQVPSNVKTLNNQQLDTLKRSVQPYRIYHRYYYTTESGEQLTTNDTWYLSSIDAILTIIEEYMKLVPFFDENQYRTIINIGELGELYNENKKYFVLDKLRKDNSIEPSHKYEVVRTVDIKGYSAKYNTINYRFTNIEDKVFQNFCELLDYKRFNLYKLTEKIISNNMQLFRKLVLEQGLLFINLDTIYFCVSGMNIYYVNSQDIGGLRLLLNLKKE